MSPDWLIKFYDSFSGESGFAKLDDISEAALRALAQVQVGGAASS